MNRFYVYILISRRKENWSYAGFTNDIRRRLKEHAYGKMKSTKGMRPLELVYKEKYLDRDLARKRELYLKSGFGREEKQSIINRSGIV